MRIFLHKGGATVDLSAVLDDTFSSSQVEEMRRAFGGIQKIDPSSETYRKMIALLDRLDQEQLKTLASAGIKFVSNLARNRVKDASGEELRARAKQVYESALRRASDPSARAQAKEDYEATLRKIGGVDSYDASQYEVIEARRWKNRKTGATASIYGAVPWGGGNGAKEDWEIQTTGFTVRNLRTGTVGIGRVPWASRSEAEAWVEKENARLSR